MREKYCWLICCERKTLWLAENKRLKAIESKRKDRPVQENYQLPVQNILPVQNMLHHQTCNYVKGEHLKKKPNSSLFRTLWHERCSPCFLRFM
jgi:hypothetical protein